MSSARPEPSQFYVTGGTIIPGEPSYVQREADAELLDLASNGEYVYILTSRQMGKSSLMARTAHELRSRGLKTAIVDLSALGTETSPEASDRWFYSFARNASRDLGLRSQFEEWWPKQFGSTAVARLTEFLSEVVLAECSQRIVIFVDEIDSTIPLPWADDFFAAIRSCFNRRGTDSRFSKVGFVLLGTASPSDLIKDPKRTPFNIGRRLELEPFDFEEARVLRGGLSGDEHRADDIVREILDWTGGHPYLTQVICRAVAELPEIERGGTTIEEIVRRRFMDPVSSRQEHNLNFVRDRLTNYGRPQRDVLRVYRDILDGKRVDHNPVSQVQSTLKLSGAIRVASPGRLMVANRIYQEVFGRDWLDEFETSLIPQLRLSDFPLFMLRSAGAYTTLMFVFGTIAFGAGYLVRELSAAELRAKMAQYEIRKQELDETARRLRLELATRSNLAAVEHDAVKKLGLEHAEPRHVFVLTGDPQQPTKPVRESSGETHAR
jgi:cell division protein FtsL